VASIGDRSKRPEIYPSAALPDNVRLLHRPPIRCRRARRRDALRPQSRAPPRGTPFTGDPRPSSRAHASPPIAALSPILDAPDA